MGDQLKEKTRETMDTGEWVKPGDFGGTVFPRKGKFSSLRCGTEHSKTAGKALITSQVKFIKTLPCPTGLTLLFTNSLQVVVRLSLRMNEPPKDLTIWSEKMCHVESAGCSCKGKRCFLPQRSQARVQKSPQVALLAAFTIAHTPRF